VPMSGEAEDMSWWSSAFHIVINILSTLLLGASNYTMQVLSSPTRGEIDRAHSSNQWLDIGVLSLRNLGRISRRRRFLCVILALSSIPIHLFYNSAVFFIGANNEYQIFLFEVGSPEYTNIYELSDAANKASNPSYKMLNSVETFRAYSSNFVSYGDVYIAIDDYASKVNKTRLDGFVTGWPNTDERIIWNSNATWPIEVHTTFPGLRISGASTQDWIDFGASPRALSGEIYTQPPLPNYAHFTHGFAKHTVGTSSRIQLSLISILIVVSCNVIKLATMLWVVFKEKSEYLVTVGDGAASFLKYPDSTTEQMCVASRSNVVGKVQSAKLHNDHDQLAVLVRDSGSTWVKQCT
jgi:hypothetical protein